MAREAGLMLVAGRKGVGKTHTTLQVMEEYAVGNPKTGAPPRRVLILDVNDEFTQYKAIDLRDIKEWCKVGRVEIRRVRIWHTFGENVGKKMTLNEIADALKMILDNYNRGMLLIEDINKYISDSVPGDLIGSICTQRHVAVDIVAHFQGVGRIGHPKLWSNANWVRLHRTDDNVERHKNKFAGFERPLKIAESLIQMKFKEGDPRFYCYFNKDTGKIFGHLFNRNDFFKAVEIYLSENYNTEVKPYLSRKDINSGRNKFNNHAEGIDSLRMEIFKEYYGN
jgi:hypothetical protein